MNKSRSTVQTGTYWGQYGAAPPTYVPDQHATVFSESFSDSGRRWADNACTHSKTVSNYDYLITGFYDPAHPSVPAQQYKLGFRAETHGYTAQPVLIPYQSPSINLHNLSADAFTAMRPTMTSQLSLSNFVFELREFKQLFTLWNRHKSVITNAAAGHLNYSFGWRPFLRDLKRIYEFIGNYEVRLHDMINRAESEQTRHFRTQVTASDVVSYYYDELYSGHKFKTVTTYNNIVFCAKMAYAYSMPNMSWSELNCRAALDAIGLNANPSQIWDAIPFSFLVDWFANVGDVVSQFNSNWLEPTLSIRSIMYSLLVEATTRTYAFPWYRQYPAQSVHWELCSQHEATRYTRSWGFPVVDHQLELTYPATLGKIALGASLFLTYRR